MNKLYLFVSLFCVALLSACGGSSSDEKVVLTVNKAPTITLESTLITNSGASVNLSAIISDPEGDKVSITWQADNQEVAFNNPNESSTLITFPITNIDLVVVITIVVKDSAGNSSQKSVTADIKAGTPSNEAPIINMPVDQTVVAGQSIILIASVQDPQGDDISVEWYSENTDIVFTDKNNLTTSLELPDVTNTIIAAITLKATDIEHNSSEKTLQLIITPNDDESAATVYIDLVDRFNTLSGDTIGISARLTSNVELESILWNISSLNVDDASIENVTQGGITESTITFTAPQVNQLTEFPVKIRAKTVTNKVFIAETIVFVAVDNTDTLEVTLPDAITIEESASASITPTIESSQAVDSFQWRWLSEQPLTLLTPNSEILNISSPAVDSDINGQLELTVVMGNISKTATTELTIKNQEIVSDVNVTATKLVAVEGQTITLNVITDNFEQIKQWSWEALNTQGNNVSESNKHFEVTAPQVSGQQTMSVVYRAKLIDDSEVMKIANITVLSETTARRTFNFDSGETPVISNGIEKTYTLSFTDPHNLVDALALDQSLTINTFDKAELTRDGTQIKLVLVTSSINSDHFDSMLLNVFYGDHMEQYPIQLKMQAD
jgi:hypothetical protein